MKITLITCCGALVLLLIAVATAGTPTSSGAVLALINGEDQLAMLDPASGKILARLPTGARPHEVVATRDGRMAYVVNSGATSASAIDLTAKTPAATWEIGWFTQPHTPCTQPHGLALSEDGTRLWVTCAPQRALFEIDTTSGKATRVWHTERDGSWMLAAMRDGSKLFVPNLEGKSLTVVERTSGRVRVIDLDESAMAIDVAPNGREVWVGGQTKLWVIDTSTLAVLSTVAMPRPMRLKFASETLVVVTTREGVSFVDAPSRKVGADSIGLEGVPKGLVISPDGKQAFVGLVAGTEVAAIDLMSRKLRAKFPLGKTPEGLAWAH